MAYWRVAERACERVPAVGSEADYPFHRGRKRRRGRTERGSMRGLAMPCRREEHCGSVAALPLERRQTRSVRGQRLWLLRLAAKGACAALSQGTAQLAGRGKGAQLCSLWVSVLTCPAHHGLRTVPNSSRGWPNITQGSSAADGRSAWARAQRMGSCAAAGHASVAGSTEGA